jgi:hypothetical protein
MRAKTIGDPAARAARALAAAAAITAAAIGLTATPAAAADVSGSGAPRAATVSFESLLGVPPGGYSLFCNDVMADCSTSGAIDLTTKAKVPASYDAKAGATRGTGPLSFASTRGEVKMNFSCKGSPEPWESKVAVTGTEPGELEVAGVEGVEGSNALAVELNPAGDSGFEFPQELVSRSDGGCDTPVQNLRQTMGTWYYQFYNAHRNEQVDFGDLRLEGLTFDPAKGVYARTYERFVTIGSGAYSYPTFEHTRVEVEPEYCAGAKHRIVSATANGQSIGLGPRLFAGQVVNAPPKTIIRLGDRTRIELEKGGRFEIAECETNSTVVELRESVARFLAHVKKAVGGSTRKFEVQTERAVAGVRGTIFEVRYDKAKRLTRVAVEESSVYLKGRNGAKGKVVVKAGRVGVQKGKRAPRLLKG